jgi:steroid delta-isomerase-like uncharacterized protein
MTMSPETLIREWFEQVWTQRQEDAIDRMMAPDALIHNLSPDGAPMRGPEACKPFHRRFLAAFPDIRVEVLQTIVNGDLVAAHCRVIAHHAGDGLGVPATGRTATIPGMVFARVKNGQIVEGWNCFDFLSLYQQLGMVPVLS